MNHIDNSAQLPDGQMFQFWEIDSKYEREIHVDNNNLCASDSNDGTYERPFKTINTAASRAEPGTRVLIHGGTYRETVQPRFGGLSPECMISYEAYKESTIIIRIAKRAVKKVRIAI